MNFLAHWYLTAIQNPYDTLWTVIGFGGQALFSVRMLIQWMKSEQEGHSVIPITFWYCSIGGGLITLVYSLSSGQVGIPFLIGQLGGLVVYARNLWLVHRERSTARAS